VSTSQKKTRIQKQVVGKLDERKLEKRIKAGFFLCSEHKKDLWASNAMLNGYACNRNYACQAYMAIAEYHYFRRSNTN